jgi:hypothetical protein
MTKSATNSLLKRFVKIQLSIGIVFVLMSGCVTLIDAPTAKSRSGADETGAENSGLYFRKPKIGELLGAEYAVRWYPKSVRFSPDDKQLIVSLCHFYHAYCKIGKYWIQENRWEIIAATAGVSMKWPEYSPDGKSIVFGRADCPNTPLCHLNPLRLAIMNADGSDAKDIGPTDVVAPTFSSDGKRVMYWRVQGSGKLSSGRNIGSWGIFEFNLEAVDAGIAEKKLTDEPFKDIQSAPRYVSLNDRILFTADTVFDFPRETIHVRFRNPVASRSPTNTLPLPPPQAPLPGWKVEGARFVLGFHSRHGFLFGGTDLFFKSAELSQEIKTVMSSKPFLTGIADISHDGNFVVGLSNLGENLSGTNTLDYFSYPDLRFVSGQPVPVMTITNITTKTVIAITNWPKDVERIVRPSKD